MDTDGDYLRLALRFAVGLNEQGARGRANKYYIAMRPFFMRRASAEEMLRCFREIGIQKMAYEGAHKEFLPSVVLTPPSDAVMKRLNELQTGALVCLVQFQRNAYGKPVISFEIPDLMFHTGHDRIETKRAPASLKRR